MESEWNGGGNGHAIKLFFPDGRQLQCTANCQHGVCSSVKTGVVYVTDKCGMPSTCSGRIIMPILHFWDATCNTRRMEDRSPQQDGRRSIVLWIVDETGRCRQCPVDQGLWQWRQFRSVEGKEPRLDGGYICDWDNGGVGGVAAISSSSRRPQMAVSPGAGSSGFGGGSNGINIIQAAEGDYYLRVRSPRWAQ